VIEFRKTHKHGSIHDTSAYSQLLFYKEILIMSQITYRIHGDEDSLTLLKRMQYFYEKTKCSLQEPQTALKILS